MLISDARVRLTYNQLISHMSYDFASTVGNDGFHGELRKFQCRALIKLDGI